MALKRRRGYSGGMRKRRRFGGPRRGPTSRRRLWRLKRNNRPYTKMIKAPVADRLFVKLKYAEIGTLTCAVQDTLSSWKAFGTGIYDPDKTAFGHQPMWRDQYASMYNSYRVRGIKYFIEAQNRNTNEAGWIGTLESNTNSFVDSTIQNWLERRNARVKMLGSVNGGSNKQIIKGYISTAKTCGVSPRIVSTDDRWAASMGSDPATMAYLLVAGQSKFGGGVIDMSLRLTYYVELYDPVTPGPS